MGAWLAVLALTLQTFVPLLVAADIAEMTGQPYANAEHICSYGPAADPSHGTGDHHQKPGLAGGCPICTALAAAQAYTAPAPVLLTPPRGGAILTLSTTGDRIVGAVATASYDPRGPPSIA